MLNLNSIETNQSNEEIFKHACEKGLTFEEKGEMHSALKLYQSSLFLIEQNSNIIEISTLKAKILYLRPSGNNQYYQDLVALKKGHLALYNSMTIQRGLLQFENKIFGVELAIKRFQIIKNKLNDNEKNILLTDLIEDIILGKKCFPIEIILNELTLNKLNIYQKNIVYLVDGDREYLETKYQQITNQISQSEYIRLLAIYTTLTKSSLLINELEVFLKKINEESLIYWEEKIAFIKSGKDILYLSLGQLRQSEETTGLDLNSQKTALKLLNHIAQVQVESLENITKILWNAQYNNNYFDRIRVTVSRINKMTKNHFDIAELVYINEESISLNPNLCIQTETTKI